MTPTRNSQPAPAAPTARTADTLRRSQPLPPAQEPALTLGNELTRAAPQPGSSAQTASPDLDEARAASVKRQRETQQDLASRYVVKDGAYHFRANPGVVAFRDEGKRLATDLDRPAVARSIVAAAELKGWKALRVQGTEEFKREAWFEASVRGIKAIGYTPTRDDIDRLERARQTQRQNRAEPGHRHTAAEPQRQDAALTLMERHLAQQKGLSPELRARVVAAGQAHSDRLAEAGTVAKVRVFDQNAERAQPHPAPQYEPHRDRGARAR